MQQMNADEGLNKVQLTLYTSRWQAAINPRARSAPAPANPRLRVPSPAPPRSAIAASPRLTLAPPDRRYTRLHEQKLAETSACCALS